MSTKSHETSVDDACDATAPASRPSSEALPGEGRLKQWKAARLRTIQELVQSDNYHIPALLVAERMIERAVTEEQDHKIV